MTPARTPATPATWGEFQTFTVDTRCPLSPQTVAEEPVSAEGDGHSSDAPEIESTANSNDPLLASPNRLVTIKAALAYLSIGRTKLNELLAAGDIPSVRIGRSHLIPFGGLQDYVDRLRGQTGCHTDAAS